MHKKLFFFLLMIMCGACSTSKSQKKIEMADSIQNISYLQFQKMKSLTVEEALKTPKLAHKVRIGLDDLNKDLSPLQYTQYVWLHRGVTYLPASITTLKNLRILDLYSKQFTQLPEDIGKLQKLEALHTRQTKIQDFPNSIEQLNALKVITLNTLNKLPKNLTKIRNLQQLYLNGPGKLELKELFKVLGKLPKLRYISMVDVYPFSQPHIVTYFSSPYF